MRPTIFVIDDHPDQVDLLTVQLERTRRFTIQGFTRAVDALDALAREVPDAIVCDLVMPGMDGLDLLTEVRKQYETLPIIVITGRSDLEGDAERALRGGANDFMAKPIQIGTLITRIKRCLDEVPAQELLATTAKARFDPHGIIGSHPLIEAVRRYVDDVASVPQVSALLLGESGTGKNMVARAIHAAGEASNYRFVEINCAALPANLLEAELFGYEKGAFTGAHQAKKGLAEVANGGTLFLDEIGTISQEVQAKLLTFLESRTFRRVGSTSETTVNLRIITATNEDLASEVKRGAFREDLYYRLNVASHLLPPLRRIRSDIPEMAGHFIKRAAEYFAKPLPKIDPASLERLQAYDWPGNARELRNVIERSMIFSKDSVLRTTGPFGPAVAQEAANTGAGIPLGLTLEEVERRYIEATIEELDGSISAAAEMLGVSRKVLWHRRKRHGTPEGA